MPIFDLYQISRRPSSALTARIKPRAALSQEAHRHRHRRAQHNRHHRAQYHRHCHCVFTIFTLWHKV